jgi:hypothetical protein
MMLSLENDINKFEFIMLMLLDSFCNLLLVHILHACLGVMNF